MPLVISVRSCPACRRRGPTFEQYGIGGFRAYCGGEDCGLVLAQRRDEDSAPTSCLTDKEVDAWTNAGTYVLVGAEAEDPAHDAMFNNLRLDYPR